MHFFHKWTKWELETRHFEVTYIGLIYSADIRGKTFEKTERWQCRKCEVCGKIQEKRITSE